MGGGHDAVAQPPFPGGMAGVTRDKKGEREEAVSYQETERKQPRHADKQAKERGNQKRRGKKQERLSRRIL